MRPLRFRCHSDEKKEKEKEKDRGRERGCVCVSPCTVSVGVCGGGARGDQRVGETFVDPGKRLRSCTLARLTDVEGRRVRGRWENGGGRGGRGTNSNIEKE